MHKFSDFDITIETPNFIGEKIKVAQILNREITIHDFKVGPSKFPKPNNDKCLSLQISLQETKRVVFTSSVGLLNLIQSVSKDKFPFTTTVIVENRGLKFT